MSVAAKSGLHVFTKTQDVHLRGNFAAATELVILRPRGLNTVAPEDLQYSPGMKVKAGDVRYHLLGPDTAGPEGAQVHQLEDLRGKKVALHYDGAVTVSDAVSYPERVL